jgi:branched-chain amino acid transport system permease protein
MAIVGGLGTLAGPVLGAIVFTYLPEKLQIFAEYQFMAYGLILLFSFIMLPKGLAAFLLPRPRFVKPLPPAAAVEPTRASKAAEGPLIRVEDLAISFLGLRALDGVSLELARGQILALVGPNGSGKSTLVNIVSGLYQPSAGRVTFASEDVTGRVDHEIARLGIARTFQDPRLAPNLTVRENALLGAYRLYRQGRLSAVLGLRSALHEEGSMLARVEAAMKMAGVASLADAVVEDLPYGDQRMTELCRVLVSDPQLVMLDEPTAGLSEVELDRLARLIRDLKERGIAVLLIEHHLEFLQDLVDQVVVLASGQVIYRGDMEGMYQSPAVVAAYLGQPEKKDVAHA